MQNNNNTPDTFNPASVGMTRTQAATFENSTTVITRTGAQPYAAPAVLVALCSDDLIGIVEGVIDDVCVFDWVVTSIKGIATSHHDLRLLMNDAQVINLSFDTDLCDPGTITHDCIVATLRHRNVPRIAIAPTNPLVAVWSAVRIFWAMLNR